MTLSIAGNIPSLHSLCSLCSLAKEIYLPDQSTILNHQLESAILKNDSTAVTTLLQSHAKEELAASTQELIITTLMSSDPDTPDLAIKTILAKKLMGDKFSVEDPIYDGKSLKDIAQSLYETTGNNELPHALLPEKYDNHIQKTNPTPPVTPERLRSFAGDLETSPTYSSSTPSPHLSSPPYPTPLRRSLSAGTLPFPKIDDDDCFTPSKEKPHYRQPIHNRGISLIEGRVTDSVAKMLNEKQQQTGKVITNNHLKSQQGNGSGILIAPHLFLTSRHCINESGNHSVVFGAHEAGMKGELFAVLQTHAADSEIARQQGLVCGPGGDFIILELANSPGKIYGYTPLKTPTTLDGTTELYFLGYSAGSHLKMSETTVRPRKLTDLTKRYGHNLQVLTNKPLSWNNGQTHGYIQDATVVDTNTHTGDKVALQVKSPTRNRQFTVQNTTVLRESGELANGHSEFYVDLSMQTGHDHIRTGHHASGGSSGGIYFTQNGTIYAVQRGMIATDPKHPDHIAYFPWRANFITIYDDQLTLENHNKKKGLKLQTASKANIQPQAASQSTASLPFITSTYASILEEEAGHKVGLIIKQYREAPPSKDKKHALNVLNTWLYPKKIDRTKVDSQSYWEDIHHNLLKGANTEFKNTADAEFTRTSRRNRQDIALGNRQAIAGSKENYCILDVGVWSWGVNQAFIEGGAFRGARFWLETAFPEAIWERFSTTTMSSRMFLEAIKPLDPSQGTTLWHSGEDRPSWYALEIAGLLDLGYVLRQEQGKNYLMPPDTSLPSNKPRSISPAVCEMGYQTYLKSIIL